MNSLSLHFGSRIICKSIAFLYSLFLIFYITTANAEPAPPQSSVPPITPPTLLTHSEVPYPDGASGASHVVVTVIVNSDGSVRTVNVAEGGEPFASVAIASVTSWRFSPATRGDIRIAATIRLLVEFTPPVIIDSNQTTQDAAPGQLQHGAAIAELDEVNVRGSKLPPTVVSLGRADIRQLPGAFGDPFRAIDILPGVTPTISGLPYFYIRGAPPSNVGYYVDGIRIPYLFHFALGPGVVNPSLLERVDLYPAGFPARWGRYAGSIVSGELAKPHDSFFGEAQIRVFDAGAIAEAPFAQGKGHILIGGRYAYPGFLLSIFAPEVAIDYKDYNLRTVYQLTTKDSLTLFGLGSVDIASNIIDGAKKVLFASEFHRVALRYDHRFNRETRFDSSIYTGLDRSRLEGKRFARDVPLAVRGNFEHNLSNSVQFRAGFDWTNDFYSTDSPNEYSISKREYEGTLRLFSPRFDFAFAAYADSVLRLGHGIELTPGARVDLFGSHGDKATSVDPRLSAKIPISKKIRIVSVHGTSHQPPAFAIPVPALGISGFPQGLQSVWQSSVGAEFDLPFELSASGNVFRNSFRNVQDLFSNTRDDPFKKAPDSFNGRAIGLEFLLRRRLTSRLGGIVSYTLSRNTRTVKGREVLNGFDRTHVFNAALSGNLGRGWRASVRLLAYTGTVRFEKTISDLYGEADSHSCRAQSDRLPSFYRLDARLEKKWTYSNGHWLTFVAEGLNVTGSREVISRSCDESDATCREEALPPIIVPSLGLEAGW